MTVIFPLAGETFSLAWVDTPTGPRVSSTVSASAMSWLWGSFNKPRVPVESGGAVDNGGGPAGGDAGGIPQDQVPEEGKKWVGFDPTGLERAAKAVRELNQSC